MSYDLRKNALLICDSFNWTIEIYQLTASLNLNLTKTIELDEWLSATLTAITASCLKNEIFIACESNEGVSVLSSDFNFIRKFGQTINYKDVDFISVDDENDDSIVYICSLKTGRLTKWNSKTGVLLNDTNVYLPRNITIHKDKLYLISQDEKTNQEYVLVLEKHSLAVLSKISSNGWNNYRGLFIDNFLNVVVTAKDENVSKHSIHLLVFNSDGDLINKFCLPGVEITSIILDIKLVKNDFFILSQELDWKFFLKRISLNK